MFDLQVLTDQRRRVMLMLREAEKVCSTGSAIFGGSASGAAISTALTVHLHTVSVEAGRVVTTTHNAFGGTPLTASEATGFTLCAMLLLSGAAIILRDLISASQARRRPARTPLQL